MPQTSHKELAAAMQSAGVDAATIKRVVAALAAKDKKKPEMPPHLKGDGDESVSKSDPWGSFVAEQEGWLPDDQLSKAAANVLPFRSLDGADLYDDNYVDAGAMAEALKAADFETSEIREELVGLLKNWQDGGTPVRNLEAVIEEFSIDPASFPHTPKRTTPQPGQARAGMSKDFAWPRDMALAMSDRRFDPNYDGDDSLTFGSDDSGPEAA